jgi:hypothetical protein
MLGAAEANFEPQVIDCRCKQRTQIGRRRPAEIQRQARQ